MLTPFRDRGRSAPDLLQFGRCQRLSVHNGRSAKITRNPPDLRVYRRPRILERVELTGLEPATPTLPDVAYMGLHLRKQHIRR